MPTADKTSHDLAIHVAMHNISGLGIRRLLEGFSEEFFTTCATTTWPGRRSPKAAYEPCADTSWGCCATICCGWMPPAVMIASTAFWAMVLSGATPSDAPA